MPVNIKLNAVAALEYLGVSPEKLLKLHSEKVKVMATTSAIKFVKDGEVLSKVEIKSSDTAKAAKKTLSSPMIKQFKQDAADAVDVALAKVTGAPVSIIAEAAPAPEKPIHKAIVENDEPTPAPKPIPKHKPQEGVFPQSKMASAPLVPLGEAGLLYQPVGGTGSSSRYFVVALSEGLKVAVRYKGSSLSIRVEGADLDAHKSDLMNLGLSMASVKHASMHVTADVSIAPRVIGSLIGAISVNWTTQMPNFQIIKKVGGV